ncbi:MAG: SAM-dependent methyltransferase [Solirubrobacteraceae bacterium]
MADLRDYEQWHRAYNDPSSSLSWRLRTVQRFIEQALDRHLGPVRVLSACAGDGRDLLEVLARRDDASRVSATLVELHTGIAGRARRHGATTAAQVEVRAADAGLSDTYIGAVPAKLVLLVGIFGNISNADLQRTVAAAPQLCDRAATLLWSRGCHDADRNGDVRRWFAAAGFTELDYVALETGSRPAVGVVRYDGPPRPLVAGRHLFTFVR